MLERTLAFAFSLFGMTFYTYTIYNNDYTNSHCIAFKVPFVSKWRHPEYTIWVKHPSVYHGKTIWYVPLPENNNPSITWGYM